MGIFYYMYRIINRLPGFFCIRDRPIMFYPVSNFFHIYITIMKKVMNTFEIAIRLTVLKS